MKNHQTLLKAVAPLGALFAVAALTGQTRPTCHPASPPAPETECVTPQDCEGLPHVMCVGEWQCVQGECRYRCESEPNGCHSDADCPQGQHCSVSDGDCQSDPNCPMCGVCYGECVPDKVACVQSGCSGEVCAPEPVFTTCVWQEWFACLKLTRCGAFGPDGTCGFEPNEAFLDCLAKLKPCKADKDCPAGLVCVNGRCDKPAPIECQSDMDCPDGFYCEVETVCPPCANEDPPCLAPCYLKGECKPKPEPKGCSSDEDCAWYEYCALPLFMDSASGGGPSALPCCPPNAFCAPEVPPCGEGECVLRPGYCWSDEDCQKGEHCEGVIPPCPPGVYCFAAPQPGKCVPNEPSKPCASDADCGPGMVCDTSECLSCCTDPSQPCIALCCGRCVPAQQGCKPVKPGSHGACEMVLGWIFDGKGCVLESGCSCEPDCGAFFETIEDCQAACLGPIPCYDDGDCPPGQVCVWSGGCPPCDCDPAAGTDCVCPACVPPASGFCQPPTCTPGKEVCDGMDNDCDGLVDEGCGAACKSDADCAPYEYCAFLPATDPATGAPTCCPPGALCGPMNLPPCEGECRLLPGYCWSDADCQKGETCEGEIICPPGAYCFVANQPGKCVPKSYVPCTSDAQCPKGQVCDTSECLSCCPFGEVCIDLCCGRCVPAQEGCQSDKDCPVGQYCNLRMDSAGNLFGSCAPVPDGACVRDADCGEGGFCQFGPCPLCFPCPCFGTCIYKEPQKCKVHSDCPPGQECHVYCGNGWCEGVCQPLPEGQCWMDKDCPEGYFCNVLKCGDGLKCLGPYECLPKQPKCIQSGCSGEVCSTESVMTPCWYLPWFECLGYTQCGNFGPGGSCAFEQTPEFLKCMAQHGL